MMDWLFGLVAYAEATGATDPATQAATDPTGGIINMLGAMLPMVAIVAIFYFMLIRPQRKKDKAVKDMLAKLKVGDRVCTIGGMFGTVTQIKDDMVTIAVGQEKAKLVFARWGIRSVENVSIQNDAEPEV